LANGIPSGAIILWSGSIATIPSGWLLCNGSSGTPDLRDRFIVGAGSTYAVAATGGSANATLVSHTHTATSTVTDPGHVHLSNAVGLLSPTINWVGTGGLSYNNGNSTNTASATTGITVGTTNSTEGSSATNANLPPYYALAYIMKT
jgi:microcystin-dependent protein